MPRGRRLDGLAGLRRGPAPWARGVRPRPTRGSAARPAAGSRPVISRQRQRVDLELQALLRALVGLLLVGDVARLVVDDHEPDRRLVHAVEAAAHPGRPQREAELPLDVGRLAARGLLLVLEARQRRPARRLALLLVLPGEEALVPPGVVEGRAGGPRARCSCPPRAGAGRTRPPCGACCRRPPCGAGAAGCAGRGRSWYLSGQVW